MSNRKVLFIVLLVSLVTHFAFFGHPNQTVFDEVHFGKFISGYYTHEYFFDIHPPLGKLIIAGFGKLFDFQPEFSFTNIGDKFPDQKYKFLRFLPLLAGAILPVVGVALALELGLSALASLVFGLLLAFENALIVQSRFILLDSFLLLFGFLSLFYYLRYRNGSTALTTSRSTTLTASGNYHLLLMGIFGALAMSVKWTGASFLALAGLSELITIVRARNFSNIISKVMAFIVVPFVIYFSIFALHFSLLTKTGTGDAFMSPGFQKTLEGNAYQKQTNLPTPNIFEKFIELNDEMYRANQRLTATHPYSSQWYTWPLLTRPIFYWISGDQRIYLLGNPVIWWASTAAVIGLLIGVLLKRFRWQYSSWLLLAGYILNLLPFIGIKRVMFLYHYFIALIFAIFMLVYILDKEKNSRNIFIGLILLSLATFIYFAPLTYGLSLSPKQYEQRTWLPSWK